MKPACWTDDRTDVDAHKRAPGFIDDGKHCRAWREEDAWIFAGHAECGSCARLQRAREIGGIIAPRRTPR